jgi:hypothetical protein
VSATFLTLDGRDWEILSAAWRRSPGAGGSYFAAGPVVAATG